jgi:guanyl-specific ribonuclease Sa
MTVPWRRSLSTRTAQESPPLLRRERSSECSPLRTVKSCTNSGAASSVASTYPAWRSARAASSCAAAATPKRSTSSSLKSRKRGELPSTSQALVKIVCRFSPKRPAEDNSWMGYLSSYLPSQVTDVFTQGRAFAAAHLPTQGVRNVISIAT